MSVTAGHTGRTDLSRGGKPSALPAGDRPTKTWVAGVPATWLRLVDVAAGTGVVAVEAARRGAEVLTTDFAPGMVELMRRQFAAEGLDARAEVMDGQALDLEDESFDLGTSTFGLIILPHPMAGLRELRRVLRPGGASGSPPGTGRGPGCRS